MTHGAKVWTALVTVYVIWGSTYLGIAVTGETIPPLFAASTRFIAAGSLMVLVVLLRGGQLRVSRRALGGSADDKQPVPTHGWFAACKDTEGNSFSLWQGDPNAA